MCCKGLDEKRGAAGAVAQVKISISALAAERPYEGIASRSLASHDRSEQPNTSKKLRAAGKIAIVMAIVTAISMAILSSAFGRI
jgi:hypothetical protein